MIVQTDAGVPQGDGLVPGGMIGSLFDTHAQCPMWFTGLWKRQKFV